MERVTSSSLLSLSRSDLVTRSRSSRSSPTLPSAPYTTRDSQSLKSGVLGWLGHEVIGGRRAKTMRTMSLPRRLIIATSSSSSSSSSLSSSIIEEAEVEVESDGSTTHKAPDYEIQRRRNFAIISHPDAGKTTLTEKLLLFGGAIQDAGAVKARADQRKATSDWMEIEKQRDTPGHQDFSEDTYRTLAAADNCVMLIDAAKGIEDRTRKLFEVCRMRKLPIFTFTNKMDRPSLTPFDIIDQLEKEFGLECCPMNWPIGDGDEFQGVFDRASQTVHLFTRGDRRKKLTATIVPLSQPDLPDIIGQSHYDKLMEDIEMLNSVIPEPDLLQANLDPKHRDRMAFIRICSGTFRKGLKVGHSRMKKTINLTSAQSLFAQDRESIVEAYPGDVIGIHNPGHFAIGDTIFTGNRRIIYPGIPSFSPEKFAYIRNPNPSTYKKFQKGLSELLDEGAVQLLRDRFDDGTGIPMLAAVGQLQFDVVQYRLQNEYGVSSKLEPLSFSLARWVGGDWESVEKAEKDDRLFGVQVVQDRWRRPVLLFRNPWKLQQLEEEAAYLKLTPWSMPPTEFV
eukprot:scaffold3054_cov152-Ochromonas_danica.AAC.2